MNAENTVLFGGDDGPRVTYNREKDERGSKGGREKRRETDPQRQ